MPVSYGTNNSFLLILFNEVIIYKVRIYFLKTVQISIITTLAETLVCKPAVGFHILNITELELSLSLKQPKLP